MNKIFKVIYSKTRHCYVVVSELAKSHCKTTQSHTVRSKIALTAAVLLALGTFSVASVFMPITAEAADKTRTDGSNFVGVERTDGLFEDSDYANYKGQGAHGDDSITIGLKASGGDGTITIGDRRAEKSLGSVYVGRGPGMPTGKVLPDKTDNGYWATSVGYQSDATGYGSIAIGSNAVANNSYDKDSTGHGITLKVTSGDSKTVTLNGKPDIQRASVAIGYGASADNGNIAIGSYSDASTDLRTVKDSAKAYLTEKTADSYVSVGKSGALRRISNVADGASASDVATVGQLQALSKEVGSYKKGFGIKIDADSTDNTKNTISLDRNLGKDYDTTDDVNLKNDAAGTSLILGGRVEKGSPTGGQSVTGDYGALGKDSVTVGGVDNTVETTGDAAVVVGGIYNKAAGTTSAVVGGSANDAIGNESAVFGGQDNDAYETYATISGGSWNKAYGKASSIFGGSINDVSGKSSVAVGGYGSHVYGDVSVGIAGGSTHADYALAAGNEATVTVNNGTAIGYQATANKKGTVAFGHDKGDVYYTSTWPQKATEKDGKYYDAQNKEITKDQYEALRNADLTFNDYSQKPKVTENKYDAAAYNRLVKVDDGVDDHDVVVMEQLKQYAEKDASNLGNNIKVYKTDEKGNVQLGKDKQPVEDKDATTTAQKNSKDAWGTALGADTFSEGTPEKATDASTSDQLVTGKTLYNYDAPVAETGKKLNYVSANNTTGQNLSALDAQVADNASKLNGKTHNIKYYSVSDNAPTLGFDSYSNAGNDGAKGRGSLAAGFVTHADGIASTVAGSYSGVINSGNAQGRDLRGAAALSYGTFNVNQNTDTAKEHSGVANSIVGQANMTTNSNAAIIYGAGNTVTDSYRPIADKASAILGNVSDPKKLSKAMQDAVKESGGQVMVMGGGNNVESAYMSQVTGVGNTVKGNQVENDKGEWVTDTSKTAIKDYNSEKSSQYNYVDGFSNEVINGKHDYVIGANNKLSGDSYDDDKAKPIKRSNKSNIVIGDNHTLTRKQNTVIIGSSDTENTQTIARDAVIIGHNANATSDTGADNAVAIGLSATATGGNAVTIGVNTSAGENSITIGSESSAISGQNIAIGRYAKVDGYEVTKAVALGQKAEAQVADGVAIGSNSIATVAGNSVEGYDPTTGQDSTDGTATWKANNAAVSIGKADGTVTRQINGVAAGTNDTDAVNVAQLKKLEGMKANVDASNIGANLKGSDGKTAASASDITANEDAWGTAIGTGTIASTSGQLVTGKTVYSEVRPSADGTYIKTANTTAANLTALDTQVGRNTTNISNLQNGEGFTDKGNTYIKNLAKGSIGMENGSHTTVSHRDANGVETYKVDVNVDGKVESGNKGIVDGGAVYSAIQDVKNQTSADLANKANVDASNLTPNNVTKWQEKLGNGKVESGNTGLVTGDTVFKAVDTKANRDGSNLTDKEADSFSEKIARGEVKAGENRAVSGDAVSQAISKVTGDMNTKLDGKANTSLDNITKDGQTVIKKLSQDAVQVKAGDDHITVDAKTDETTGNKTYTISAKDGKVASGDTGLISGGTLYNEVHVDKDGSYIKSGNTVGNNLSTLDTGLKNTSSLIHTNTSGDTIHIGETSKATKVDVSSTDANGNKNGRVVTGVVTDAKDANSAANVGYVNGVTAANTQQIYRDMNNAYSRLDTNINRAAAGSNALAALHPLDFDPADKASFAVGYGHYRNANAAAVGAFYQPNANTMVNMGISLGNGDPGFNAGVSFKIGKGSAYNGVSKAEMAQTIHDQATEISAIKADDAAKDKRIDALEKENQEMKKQIQEILARLNG